MKHDPQFTEDIIRFKILTETPLKDTFRIFSLDKQIVLAEIVLNNLKQYATDEGLNMDIRTWTKFCKTANWQDVGSAAIKSQTFVGKAKKVLDKMKSFCYTLM